ncbi:hypothetical protein [Umezawaea beigongshangensis]|uniref:hypothetical protein n=1 Tax=Umezawaea beigongshangensis TaxID=2780383 RepID=UPI0018F1AEB9|nr:hypothetical protein [Umezawaea beigongshangensis]
MTTVDETLRNAVLERLTDLDEAAEKGEAATLVPLARAEIHRLADGWRLLLTVHQPDDDGRCRACPGWLRRRRWPCQVWGMAHQHLVGDGTPHRERRRPLRDALRRDRSPAGEVVPELVAPPEVPVVPDEVDTPPLGTPVIAAPEVEPPPDVPEESPAEVTVEIPVVPAEQAAGAHRAPVRSRPRHALPD